MHAVDISRSPSDASRAKPRTILVTANIYWNGHFGHGHSQNGLFGIIELAAARVLLKLGLPNINNNGAA